MYLSHGPFRPKRQEEGQPAWSAGDFYSPVSVAGPYILRPWIPWTQAPSSVPWDASSHFAAPHCYSARHQFHGEEVRTWQCHEGDGPTQIGEVHQRPGPWVAFQPTSCFALWGCLGAAGWDHSLCVKCHAFRAWRISTHTQTSGDTDGRSYGDH